MFDWRYRICRLGYGAKSEGLIVLNFDSTHKIPIKFGKMVAMFDGKLCTFKFLPLYKAKNSTSEVCNKGSAEESESVTEVIASLLSSVLTVAPHW